MLLLVSAGPLFGNFLRGRAVNLGSKPERTLSPTIDLGLSRYPTPTDQARFFQQVIRRIKS